MMNKIPKNFDVWFRKPNVYDLPNVDTSISLNDYLKRVKKKKKR